MRWPWARAHADRSGVAEAVERLERAADIDPEVDAIVSDHERILARDEFATMIAAALRLRRDR